MQSCLGYNVWEQVIKFENNIGVGQIYYLKFLLGNENFEI